MILLNIKTSKKDNLKNHSTKHGKTGKSNPKSIKYILDGLI
jgi:hypothetical protein